MEPSASLLNTEEENCFSSIPDIGPGCVGASREKPQMARSDMLLALPVAALLLLHAVTAYTPDTHQTGLIKPDASEGVPKPPVFPSSFEVQKNQHASSLQRPRCFML